MRHTLSKAERLSNKKSIDKLFGKGRDKAEAVFLYPFRVVYQLENNFENKIISIIISVPKRSFKKAVDRNLIKRRIKEAYRLNKYLIYKEEQIILPINIGFIYVGKEILPFSLIESKMIAILQKIVATCEAKII